MEKAVLIRYVAGDATGEEKAEVVKWLDASPENMREFLALRKLFDITVWQDPAEKKVGIIPETEQKKPFIGKMLTEFIKIAAIFLLVFLVFRVFYREESKSPVMMQTVRVPAGQRAEVILADGSHVWLNANSTLTYPNIFDPGKREVNLHGEAYFNVTHQSSQPFLVKTGNYEVRVLGTEFNLLAYDEKQVFEVSLLKGSVEVLLSGAENGVTLKPDQRLVVKDNQFITSSITHPAYFLWKEGIISFDNEAFPELVRKLELYFDLKINVENQRILSYRCTGKFRSKDGVEHILKVLQISNKFNYSIDDKQNLITIR